MQQYCQSHSKVFLSLYHILFLTYSNLPMLHSFLDILEPSTYAQVQKHPQWYQAMSDEFNTLIQDQT